MTCWIATLSLNTGSVQLIFFSICPLLRVSTLECGQLMTRGGSVSLTWMLSWQEAVWLLTGLLARKVSVCLPSIISPSSCLAHAGSADTYLRQGEGQAVGLRQYLT